MVEREKKETPFSIALKHLLKANGWGSNKKLADIIGHNQGYVSDLSNGRRVGGVDLRVEIARFFDLNYEQMVSLGEWIIKGSDPNDWHPAVASQATKPHPSPITQHGHTNQAAGKNFTAPGQNLMQIGTQLNKMEQELIDTMRHATLSDWAKVSAILEDIRSRG